MASTNRLKKQLGRRKATRFFHKKGKYIKKFKKDRLLIVNIIRFRYKASELETERKNVL